MADTSKSPKPDCGRSPSPDDLHAADDIFQDDVTNDTDLLLAEEEEEEDVKREPLLTDAPRKCRKRRCKEADTDHLLLARKRLFFDVLDRPTISRFCVEGEIVDMEDSVSCSDQRKFFARIFNALEHFSQCKFEDRDPLHRILSLEAQLTVKRLKKLKENGYKQFYLSITSAVLYVLRAMADVQYIRPNDIIVQLVPVTCTIDSNVRERLRVNGLELREVNSSVSLSVQLSMDVKLLYGGQIRVKTLPAQGDKHHVFPAVCMGDYMNTAVHDLYDFIYDRTKEYIQSFYRLYPEDSAATPCSDVFADIDTRNMYHAGGNKMKMKETKDRQILSYLLRSVGREVNLKKVDLDRNTVFVLTSALNKKQKYLRAGSDLTCTVTSSPVADAEAVFLSSFVRARIMEDGSLHFQIYSRTGMYISDNCDFPEATAVPTATTEASDHCDRK